MGRSCHFPQAMTPGICALRMLVVKIMFFFVNASVKKGHKSLIPLTGGSETMDLLVLLRN